MPTYVRGVQDTADFEAGIKKLDVRDKIFELQPNKNPFIVVLGKMTKYPAKDTEFIWFEDDLIGNYTQLNMAAHAAAGATILTVDDAGLFQESDIVLVVDTGETMLVQSVDPTNNKITVLRSWGAVAAAQIDDNKYLYKLGNAMQEGYTVGESLISKKAKKSNYVQSFSKSVSITNIATRVAVYGGDRRNYERNKKGVEFMREIESQFLFGEKNEDVTSGPHPRRSTGGVYEFIKANAPTKDMNGAAVTESAFEDWLKDVFFYDEGDRWLFTSTLVNSQISGWARPKQRIEPGVKTTYGVVVNRYLSANGIVNIATDRHFSGPYKGWGFCLKMDELAYRFLNGEDVKIGVDLQNKKDKYKLDEWEGTAGLEIHHSEKHGILCRVGG